MTSPAAIQDLVTRFAEHIDVYKSGTYNETQLRRDFLDPFFKELGWDMDNTAGYAEAYRDVIHEDRVKVSGGKIKAPDYGFCVGGQRKFFLEAKKPSVKIKDDISAAYQLRRYAWSAKLPLSILSDFEEFAIYDTRIKPFTRDAPSKARIFYCRFEDYPQQWDHIRGIFSKEAILKGSFDKYATTTKGKRGTAEVDTDFLAAIEGWRADLARNLALRNPGLSQRELNFAVQRVLDRIIFLRICEDRGIEDYERLKKAADAKGIYPALVKLFQQADNRYNSGLFHFTSERSRHEEHDTLTPQLVIDDALLKPLLRGLYYPDSPYEFSVFSADILGQVYEQFLGKIITLDSRHRAQVEDKPEVKKAGGVFYTPVYIVQYIVRQTVGPLIEGKTPKQIEKIRVLDPACGSGSFLIGAYQFLLDWHLRHYITHDPVKHAKGKNPVLVAAAGGGWALTTAERKRILLAHIYGVDIDSQAVEVTKLSLLLKVLEGETAQTVQRELIQERVLPDLGENIKCGNSLIASDFYDQPGLPEMDADAHLRINVFDWDGKDGFPEIMKAGGFDAVIGNPPYLRIQGLQENYGDQIAYFLAHYASAAKRFDFYMLFIEQGHRLMSPRGRLGFICPHKFITADNASNLRSFLAGKRAIEKLISFGHNLVFSQASTYTGILILTREPRTNLFFAEIPATPPSQLAQALDQYGLNPIPTEIPHRVLSADPWQLTTGGSGKLLKKLSRGRKTIGDVFSEVLVGVQSGIDDVHVMREVLQSKNGILELHSEREDAVLPIEQEIAKPFLMGNDVIRYQEAVPEYRCLYPYRTDQGRTRVLNENDLSSRFPKAYAYLRRHQLYLAEIRRRQKTNPVYWYSCHRSRDMTVFERERIVSPEISKGCNFTIVPGGIYNNTQVYSYVPSDARHESTCYWLGILNSKVLWWFLTQTGTVLRGGYFRFKTNYLRPFPVPLIDPKSESDQAAHDRIVALVEKMLALHPQRAAAKTPHEQTALDRQIAATDKQIDAEVYALYGLTAEEIAIVEGRAADPAAPAASEGTAASSAAAAHHHHVFLREEPAEYRVNPKP